MRRMHFYAYLALNVAVANAEPLNNLSPEQLQEVVKEDLTEGKVNEARRKLEEASFRTHSVKIELAIIQTLMQTGEYNHALSAAAHTRAEHKDEPEANIFYAWLLALAGQYKPAQDILSDFEVPNEMLAILSRQIDMRALNEAELHTSYIQLYPYTTNSSGFRAIQTGVFINNSQYLISTRLPDMSKKTYKLRDGLGNIFQAQLIDNFTDSTLMILKVESHPRKASSASINYPRPGLPLHLIGYSPQQLTHVNWPLLYTSVPGIPSTGANLPIQSPTLTSGAGAYNPAGELVGITSDQHGQVIIPLTKVIEFLKLPVGAQNKNSALAGARSPADIYEVALANSVQLLAEDR